MGGSRIHWRLAKQYQRRQHLTDREAVAIASARRCDWLAVKVEIVRGLNSEMQRTAFRNSPSGVPTERGFERAKADRLSILGGPNDNRLEKGPYR
jgi:hypothetical protein